MKNIMIIAIVWALIASVLLIVVFSTDCTTCKSLEKGLKSAITNLELARSTHRKAIAAKFTLLNKQTKELIVLKNRVANIPGMDAEYPDIYKTKEWITLDTEYRDFMTLATWFAIQHNLEKGWYEYFTKNSWYVEPLTPEEIKSLELKQTTIIPDIPDVHYYFPFQKREKGYR